MKYVATFEKSQNVYFVHPEQDQFYDKCILVKKEYGFTREDAEAIAKALNHRIAERNLSAAISEMEKAREEYFAALGQINPDHIPF